MLFAVAALPNPSARQPANMGLNEIPYHIPAVFKLLVSVTPQPASSLIFGDDGEPLAIAGEARAGLQRLRQFRALLPATSKAAPGVDAAIDFLSQPHLGQFPFFLLEPGEIFSLNDTPMDEQLAELIEEIEGLTPEALLPIAKQFYDRDWPEDWTDILYFEVGSRVRPPVNAKDTFLLTTPEHLLENEALLPTAAATQVYLEFEGDDPLLEPAIAALAKLPRLVDLHLSGPCTHLPDTIGNLTRLTAFVAGGMGLTDLPASFAKLTNLENLCLQQNQFREFPAAMRNLKQLDNLSFWGMPITSVPPWINEFTKLRSILLNGCALTRLPDELFSLPALTKLDVSNNPDITALPDTISHATSLEALTAMGCALTTLPESLASLPSLASLYVADNSIAEIPRPIRKMRLDMLSIAGNPIRSSFWTRFTYNAKRVIHK
jgi:hypothetical protein